MRQETKTIVNKIIDTALKKKEQTKIFRELRETITTTMEVMKYEIIEENILEQVLREIAETTTKTSCNTIKHPDSSIKDVLNTKNIKIHQLLKTRTITCTEVKLHGITQLVITFKIEAYEIQINNKKYMIITNIEEMKSNH